MLRVLSKGRPHGGTREVGMGLLMTKINLRLMLRVRGSLFFWRSFIHGR